jgi:hypothetical protein
MLAAIHVQAQKRVRRFHALLVVQIVVLKAVANVALQHNHWHTSGARSAAGSSRAQKILNSDTPSS